LSIVCPPLSHRLPEVFTNPDRYDPDRFSPERAEDRTTPFSLVTFGGGGHRCLGMHYAYAVVKVVLTLLLQRYALRLVQPGSTEPPGRLSVAYRARG
jgi:sterol 14-demethylase